MNAPMNSQPNAPKRRRVYLMRHGSVTYFDETGKPFDPDQVPLNGLGRQQATAAGALFAAHEVKFDRVIVSGLPRTVETATLVLQQTGQQCDLERWPEWEELRGGKLAAIPEGELHKAFTGAFEGVVPEERQFLGGETIGQLMDRVLPPLHRLRQESDWDTVLLVLHGGVNRALLSHALTGGRTFLGNLAQTAGCINALDVGSDPADWVLRFSNLSPPLLLQGDSRSTTMEVLFEQYKKFRDLN